MSGRKRRPSGASIGFRSSSEISDIPPGSMHPYLETRSMFTIDRPLRPEVHL
jgi:hypothetical protein